MTSNEKLKLARKRLAELKKRGPGGYIPDDNSLHSASLDTAGHEEADLNAHRLAQALEEVALLKEQNRRFRDKIEQLEHKLAETEKQPSPEPIKAPSPPQPKVESPELQVAPAEPAVESKPVESVAVESEPIESKPVDQVEDLHEQEVPPPKPKAESPKHRVAIAETPTVIESKPVDQAEDLQKWKGWQVDLRGWKTLGVGPQIDI